MSVGNEVFRATGTIVKERNYLDVFKYERLTENLLPPLQVGEKVTLASLSFEEGKTTVGAVRGLNRRRRSCYPSRS